MKILDRYILRELWGPFLNGVVAFLAILTAGFILPKMVDYLTGPQPLSLKNAGLVFLYELPSVLVLTFPMSSLLAALQGFGRLSTDSETIVMRAGGISFIRMMRWVFVLGLVVSAGTLWFNETLVPAGNSRAQKVVLAAGRNAPASSAQVLQDWDDSKTSRSGRIVIYQSYDALKETLNQVSMLQYNKDRVSAIINAKEAHYLKDKKAWVFENGYIQLVSESGPVTRLPFDRHILTLSKRPDEVALGERKPDEMTYEELRRHINKLASEGSDVNKYLVDLQMKLSLPLASFVFVLIGAPLGLRPHRGGSALGFGLAIMIVFFYYVLAHFLAAAGESGSVSPALAAWLPDIAGTIFGIGLITKAAR